MLKLWAGTRYPDPPKQSWIGGRYVSESTAVCEAALGFPLLAGLWPRPTWLAAISIFGLFAVITAAEAIEGKASCGCFGAVHIRPIYTMWFDLLAVVLLLVTGRPDRAPEVVDRGPARRRWIVAGSTCTVWGGIVVGMWLTKPPVAMATAATQGPTFGKPGELVVLEPEKWPGQRFSLADHIDVGSQLTTGQWIVLLVHHDCDHCAAAVPRYVAEYGGSRRSEATGREERLAVIEMPPFADAADPPPWQVPPSVLSGRLDQTRDWFATTPVALSIKDGLILSSKESDAAETSPGL
jgi:hypothetical protein